MRQSVSSSWLSALAFVGALGAVALRVGGVGRPAGVDAARFVAAAQGDETATATADVPDGKADLVIGWWWYDFDFTYCIRPGQGRVLVVLIENVGRAAAGGFSVRAANTAWRVDALAAGDSRRLTSPLYPVWPLVVDADDEVAESDETNNSAGPNAAATWTPTIVSTEPPACTATVTPMMTETPTAAPPGPTATPSPPGPLSDLTILFANWAADPAVPMCEQFGPGARWATTVRIANGGLVAAGPFSVAATNLHWDVDGLGAGLTRDLVGPHGVYPAWPIVIDPENAVRESDESNNTFGPDPDRTWTPTPAATQPPTCTPTPSPTPPPTPIRLPWAGRGTLPGLP